MNQFLTGSWACSLRSPLPLVRKHWLFTLIVPYFMGAGPCALPLYPLHFHAPTLIVDSPQ